MSANAMTALDPARFEKMAALAEVSGK